MTSERAKLIERLENATEGSRELDALIWAHLAGVKYVSHNPVGFGYGRESPQTQVEFKESGKRVAVCTRDRGAFVHAEAVTTSLDAAVALVERQGFGWLRRSVHVMSVHRPLTDEQEARKEWGKHFEATGPNPALALILALLKAMEGEG